MTELLDAPAGTQDVQTFLDRPLRLFIDGKFVEAQSGHTFEVVNPATEQVIAHVSEAGVADVDLAVRAARRAFEGPWSKMLPSERAKLMWRLADLIDAHHDELALLETLNNGKTLASAKRIDVPDTADRFRYFAGWCTKLSGTTLSSQGPEGWHAYTLREPVGVVALVTAWNFPLFQAANKMAPALAAGCTVILKPAENTPLTSIRLAELAREAGFPDGVINVVPGFGRVAGAALAANPDVDKISFTGSTATGKAVLDAAKGNLKRVTLELGGKSPVIIFPDADLSKAIPAAAFSIFFNAGQVCTAGSRLFAHASVFDKVVEGIAEQAAKLRLGPGIDPNSDLGPVVSKAQLDRILGYCDGAAAHAEIVTGGKRVDRTGYFVEPTIVAGVSRDMAIQTEEVFGPVLTASRFDEEDLDGIARLANDTIYGLAAYVWTRDLGTAHRIARKIKSGLVNVNGGRRDSSVPSGGYKQSGWGREHGLAGVEAFTEVKSVVMGL